VAVEECEPVIINDAPEHGDCSSDFRAWIFKRLRCANWRAQGYNNNNTETQRLINLYHQLGLLQSKRLLVQRGPQELHCPPLPLLLVSYLRQIRVAAPSSSAAQSHSMLRACTHHACPSLPSAAIRWSLSISARSDLRSCSAS
jgi:hypothetical protein